MILNGCKPLAIGYLWREIATKDLRAIQTDQPHYTCRFARSRLFHCEGPSQLQTLIMKKETKRLLVRGTFFVLYLAMGMLVFRELESHNEQLGMLRAKQAVDRMLIKYNISHDVMNEFVATITEAESWGYTSGWLEKWTFTGSLFFSGTVITTIGESIVTLESFVLNFKFVLLPNVKE